MLTLCRKRNPRTGTRLSKRRIMRSTGHNMVSVGVEDKHWKYLSDLYTTLIDMQWRWNILIFISGFLLTWLVFACLFYLLCYLHGDLQLPREPQFVPCLQNVASFAAALLFSVETMTTIGYGFRFQTEACPVVVLTVMTQSILGAGLQFMLASIVVAKTRRAKRGSQTILFSQQVCVHQQDGVLQLSVRLADMRASHIAGAHAQAYLVQKSKTKEGTFIPVRSYNVNLTGESGRDEIFFPWPTQLIHLVDENSPLWSLSRDELLQGRHELVVVLDGISGATSRPFRARKSYHGWEILWGHRFENLEMTLGKSGGYVLSLTNFHRTVATSTPLCSARDISHLRQLCASAQQQQPPASLEDDQDPTEDSLAEVEAAGCSTAETDLTCSSQQVDIDKNPNKDTLPEASQSEAKATSQPNTTRRSRSAGEASQLLLQQQKHSENSRRCSLGDMIRVAQGRSLSDQSQFADVLNLYRHRRSVTDTYLGCDIQEDVEDVFDGDPDTLPSSGAQSAERSPQRGQPKVRPLVSRPRCSVQLMFGTKTETLCSTDQERSQEGLSIQETRSVVETADRNKKNVDQRILTGKTETTDSEITCQKNKLDVDGDSKRTGFFLRRKRPSPLFFQSNSTSIASDSLSSEV